MVWRIRSEKTVENFFRHFLLLLLLIYLFQGTVIGEHKYRERKGLSNKMIQPHISIQETAITHVHRLYLQSKWFTPAESGYITLNKTAPWLFQRIVPL
ncbi:hypothetical protein GDO86_008789 [Hymenochirus boettgeri]|uniref:Uncharacterized protein n=1 Tax=Hymenochirus boettgeri TaxID=247094 RepID=A0A8T2J3H2_9PIPI|nr:hypothetical protein GDO86_008789 [Hymenochirus boettgeri]